MDQLGRKGLFILNDTIFPNLSEKNPCKLQVGHFPHPLDKLTSILVPGNQEVKKLSSIFDLVD
jgi:hypothetical protein